MQGAPSERKPNRVESTVRTPVLFKQAARAEDVAGMWSTRVSPLLAGGFGEPTANRTVVRQPQKD
jgi:hypothetical protein